MENNSRKQNKNFYDAHAYRLNCSESFHDTKASKGCLDEIRTFPKEARGKKLSPSVVLLHSTDSGETKNWTAEKDPFIKSYNFCDISGDLCDLGISKIILFHKLN